MDVNECAKKLREEGYEVSVWVPENGSVEPNIVARRCGRFFNVYLRKVDAKKAEEFAKLHEATVMFIE